MPRYPHLPFFSPRSRRAQPTVRLKRVFHIHLTLELTSADDCEAVLSKAKEVLGRAECKVDVKIGAPTCEGRSTGPQSLAAVAHLSESDQLEYAAAMIENSCPAVNELVQQVHAVGQCLVQHQARLNDQSKAIQALSRAPNPPTTMATSQDLPRCDMPVCAGPKSFKELASLTQAEFSTLKADDVQQNRRLACSLFIINPAPSSSSRSDVQYSQGVLDQLDVQATVLRAQRTICAGNEAILVVLNSYNAPQVCAEFRRNRAFLDCPPTMCLKVNRTLLLRYAMFRMFRTFERLKSSGSEEVVFESGWYMNFGNEGCFSPYSFLSPTIQLKSGRLVSVCGT